MSGNDARIVGVALKLARGTVWSLEAPNRHGDLIGVMARHETTGDIARAEQGFSTDDCDFLTRTEAYRLAAVNGQLKPRVVTVDGVTRTHNPTGPDLYSEDLW